MESNVIADLLFIQNPQAIRVSHYILECSQKFLGVFFLLGTILEFAADWNFAGVLKRLIFASILLVSFESMLIKGVNLSFEISGTLLKRFSPNNNLVKAFQKAKSESLKENGAKSQAIFGYLRAIPNLLIDSATSITLYILKFLSFLLLKHIYSLVYFLLYSFFGLSALLSILNISQKSLEGSIKTLFWLFLTPLVLTITLILIDGIFEFKNPQGISVTSNLENSLHLLVTCISLLMAPVFSTALIAGTGLGQVGDKIASMGAMAGFMMPQKLGTFPFRRIGSIAYKNGEAKMISTSKASGKKAMIKIQSLRPTQDDPHLSSIYNTPTKNSNSFAKIKYLEPQNKDPLLGPNYSQSKNYQSSFKKDFKHEPLSNRARTKNRKNYPRNNFDSSPF